MTQHRNLNYGDRFPEAVSDALQELLSTLLVNLRLTLANPTTVQVVAGADNAQVGATMNGKWRWITATINAAHPAGAAGQYDVFVTSGPNVFTPSGLPPGSPPEIDNTDYRFFLTIKAQGSTPSGTGNETQWRKIAETTWDGAKITRITMTAGAVTAGGPGEFVAIAPENAARNRIQALADFIPFSIRRRNNTDGSDLFDLEDETGAVLVRFTRDGLVMPVNLTTALRNAITAGRRPPGGILFNSSTKQHETNIGTDATPVWSAVGGYGAGVGLDFYGPESEIPPRTALADGHFLDIAGEPNLYNKLTHSGAQGNPWDTMGGLPAPPAGKYRTPDLRGRGSVGKKDMGASNPDTPTLTGVAITRAAAATMAAILGEEFHTLVSAEMSPHTHTGQTGIQSASHTHTDSGHVHTVNDPSHRHQQDPQTAYKDVAAGTSGSQWTGDVRTGFTAFASTGVTINSGTANLGVQSANHTHAIPLEGGGGSHENVHPVVVVNKLVTL